MEHKESKNTVLKLILTVIGIGVWTIVLQNAGIIPQSVGTTEDGIQTVYVKGGHLNTSVFGKVHIEGRVGIDNTVSVSIDEVLGEDGKKYYYNNR